MGLLKEIKYFRFFFLKNQPKITKNNWEWQLFLCRLGLPNFKAFSNVLSQTKGTSQN
jgi:hypothetical protein